MCGPAHPLTKTSLFPVWGCGPVHGFLGEPTFSLLWDECSGGQLPGHVVAARLVSQETAEWLGPFTSPQGCVRNPVSPHPHQHGRGHCFCSQRLERRLLGFNLHVLPANGREHLCAVAYCCCASSSGKRLLGSLARSLIGLLPLGTVTGEWWRSEGPLCVEILALSQVRGSQFRLGD